jgi:hypothetical protein
MKRSIFIIIFFCLLVPLSEAQLWKMKRYETVVGFGPTLLFGDIGGFSKTENILGIRDMSFLQTRFNMNVNLRYRINQDFNVRLSFEYALLHATDKRGSNEKRGFEATISAFEPAVLAEYFFIKNMSESSYLFSKGRSRGLGGLIKSLDFYAFTGIGGLGYTVQPNDKLNDMIASLDTEPGGFTAVIPVGLGSSLIYTPNLNFGVEISGRYSFSDYLDGYTSQYSSSNDVYYFVNFTVTYKMKTGPHGLPSFR